jgi:hypothetical protein
MMMISVVIHAFFDHFLLSYAPASIFSQDIFKHFGCLRKRIFGALSTMLVQVTCVYMSGPSVWPQEFCMLRWPVGVTARRCKMETFGCP